jgi:hypothetical protein
MEPGWPKEIAPVCNPLQSPHIACTPYTSGAQKEWLFTSDANYPNGVQISGVPPITGWTFYYASSSRNAYNNMYSSGTQGWKIRSVMYPYNNQNAYPCFDASPVFAENPRIIYTSGIDQFINPNITDFDNDSLVFDWAYPLDNNGANLSYNVGYNYDSPLPSSTQNSLNSDPTMDSTTGIISFKSFTSGSFLTCQKVSSYRNGVKISECYGDQPYYIISGNTTNTPPSVNGGNINPLLIVDTVVAGTLVTKAFTSSDFQMHPNGAIQYVSFEYSGSQFGNYIAPTPGQTNGTLSTTAGCKTPPCASLSAAPGPNISVSSPISLATNFSWQTSIDHSSLKHTDYYFHLTFQDDYCPLPAQAHAIYKVVVKPSSGITQQPNIECIQVDSLGDVKVYYNPINDSLGIFHKLLLYHSTSISGPYQIIDTILNPNLNSITHQNAQADQQQNFYYTELQYNFGTNVFSRFSDTVSSIYLNDQSSTSELVNLSWNHINNSHIPNSSNSYIVITKGQGNTSIGPGVATTFNMHNDTIDHCHMDKRFRVLLPCTNLIDSLGNSVSVNSTSNYTPFKTYVKVGPNAPVLDSYTLDSNANTIDINFSISNTNSLASFYIYKFTQGNWALYDSLPNTGMFSYTDPSFDSAGPEHYKISAVDSCGQESQQSQTLSGVSVHNTTTDISCRIVPNPSSGFIYIQVRNLERVEIYDAQMRQVKVDESKSKKVNLEGLKQGIYIVKVFHDNKISTKQIMLQ